MKAKKNKNENDAIAWMKRMRMRMKKRQVINHRFRSVFHSAFVTTKVEKSNFYKDLEQVIEWEDSTINISKNSISPRKL
jgi:hypothetical protein